MIITKKEIILRATFTALTLLLTAFIWLNSLESAEDSARESADMLNFLNMIIQKLQLNSNLTDHIVRKLAHFLEFTAFGAMLSATFIAYKGELLKQIQNMLFIMLFVPVIDEALQYFSPGRSPQISDVLLDFSGCITGLIFTALIYTLIKYNKEKGIKRSGKHKRK